MTPEPTNIVAIVFECEIDDILDSSGSVNFKCVRYVVCVCGQPWLELV